MIRLFVLVLSDLIVLNGAYITAYILKFKLKFHDTMIFAYGNYYPQASVEPYIKSLYLISLLWIVAVILFHGYRERRGILAGIEELMNIMLAGLLATFLIMASTMIFQVFPGSRFVLLYGFIITVIFMTVIRFLVFRWDAWRRRKSRIRVVILGTDELSQTVYERLIRDRKHHYEVIGALGAEPKKLLYSLEDSYKYLGELDQILDVVRHENIQGLYIATRELSRAQLSAIIDPLIDQGVSLWMIPSFYDVVTSRIETNDDIGLPLFTIRENSLNVFQYFVKRIVDTVLAATISLLISPLLVVIALFIKLEGKGPILYKQERIGMNGKHFMMLKFRTMPVDVEQHSGPVIHTEDQSHRTTSLGAFLRKASFDELPQLFNIIVGEMSLVGPRPERPFFVDQFKIEIPDYDKRHRVLPGLTGWAQINGRAALSTRTDEKLMYDLYYINNWSLGFDVKIIIKTIVEVIRWRGAY
jgi:exopolysaccharide biosynthesis polyprenyl glycosylphosphotransferase